MKALVPFSGGKDSQACLKLACAHYGPSNVRALFCDTKFEHPETYLHVLSIVIRYGVELDIVSDGDVLQQSERFGRFPGGGSRHCTDYLKIRPTKKYIARKAAELGHPFEVWYGMRTAESTQRERKYAGKVSDELYPPHEIMPGKYPKYLHRKFGVQFRLAVLEWSRLDVLEYLDGEEHMHYALGFDRVGCFPCLASGDVHKEKAFEHDGFGRSQKEKVMIVSQKIGKSIWTSKGGSERNEGCGVCAT